MAKFVATIKAIITRLVFASHGFIAIWQVATFKKNPLYWYLSGPIILLFFEGIFTVTIKANQEWKWFCPSVFLYLGSVVPAIWLLELDKLERRMRVRDSNINISETLDLTNLAADDLKHLEKVFGVNLKLPDIKISTETWVTLIEQFLMLVLIVGRWMLPKGDLTRDQLSQLLLVYIGTAADIIEFFDSFKEDKIGRELVLVYLTLGIWSWSLMQFTVVLTATKSRKCRLSSGTTIKKKVSSKTSCCSIDVWAIAINMILQDAPFLAFRLIIIIHYQIRREVMSSISVISRNDLYKCGSSRNGKKRRRNDENVESDSEDYLSENQDIDEIPEKHSHRTKRQKRQDTGYSTSSTHNSSKHDKIQKLKGKRTKACRNVEAQLDILSYDEDIEKKLMKNQKKKMGKIDSHTRRSAIKNKNDCDKTAAKRSDKMIVNYQSTEDSSDEESSTIDESETESEQRYARHKSHRV
ncbi:hypothetical protein PV328_000931 [Microctonus aethiopoides]|uniref:Transmembrane protein 26 n=1 Tax=Microctonus aethiopoides TaxID=144406 RepID=A0AA39KWY6_9HYME|nr:hypothetical protein PV328_000931 [Microctonus aethiopoides]